MSRRHKVFLVVWLLIVAILGVLTVIDLTT